MRDVRTQLAVIGAVLLLVFGAGAAVYGAWQDRAARQEAIKAADQQRRVAQAWFDVAQEIQGRVDTVVQVLHLRDAGVDERVRVVRQLPVPEDCEEIVQEHREAMGGLEEQRDRWRAAYREQLAAAVRFRVAYDSLDHAYSALRAVAVPRRGWLPRPRIKPGGFAGICVGGQMCAGVGLTLTFTFGG